MENDKIKKKGLTKAVILLIILVVIALGVGFAYARYITRLNGTTTADIAQWSFKVNGKTNENFVIDLATTRAGVIQEAEVQEGYIGPGTAGAFELVLDATGSEVSLEYDINMNVDYIDNRVFPKNLIFYSDSTMQNAIYHTDDNINLNGFIGWNDGDKVHTKTIYWKWDYETGSTQTEIDNNDIADSYWMGKPITLSMNVTAKQVNENPTAGQYAVTFDANGGTLQGYGNSSQATKMVTYGDTYGTLPTPTREGYTFMGWNGRNLYNPNNIKKIDDNVTINSEDWVTFNTVAEQKWYNCYTYNLDVTESTVYKIVLEIGEAANLTGFFNLTSRNGNQGSQFYTSGISYADLQANSIIIRNVSTKETIENNEGLRTVYENRNYNNGERMSYRISVLEQDDSITAENFQYEPYYITSSTEVIQNQNHTLTAIWEPTSNSNP